MTICQRRVYEMRRKQLRWCENIKTFDCFMHSLRSWKNSTVCECTFSKM